MLRKLSIKYIIYLFSFFVIIYFFNITIKTIDFKCIKEITLYVSIEDDINEYHVPLGTTFSSLKKLIINNNNNVDFSSIDDNYRLYNNETIYLNTNKGFKISINDNSIDNLIKLPGIGEKTALKIIRYRNKYGDFERIDDIKNVSGIGDKKFEKIKEYISI